MKILQKICLVLLLTAFSSVYAGDCFKDGDVDDCFTKAEQGVFEAYNELGIIYYAGRGVEQNYRDAFYFWEMAAEEGISASQLNLGQMYYVGEGVAQSNQEALKWFKKAAEQGDAFAEEQVKIIEEKIVRDTEKEKIAKIQERNAVEQYNLGKMYFDKHVLGSAEKAVKLWRVSAKQGNAKAQKSLGVMYWKGIGGVSQDDQEAFKWFKKAAKQGNADAQFFAGTLLGSGYEAMRWYELAAKQGHSDAIKRIGIMKEESAASAERRKSDKFQRDLESGIALAVVISFIGMLIVGMNNKIVIYFDKRDFYISLMPWVLLVIGFVISSMIEMPLIRNSFLVISAIAAVSFFGWSVRLSVFYNQSTPVGVFVGIFKVLCSAVGVVLLVGTIQKMFSRDSGVKDFIVATILLGVFIWIGKKLINGEQVYLSKGWNLPGEPLKVDTISSSQWY